MKNNLTSPLKLTLHSGGYKVNKPGEQDGEYVDKKIADEMLDALIKFMAVYKENKGMMPVLLRPEISLIEQAIKKATE